MSSLNQADNPKPNVSPGRVLLVSTVMLTFITYWRTAAVVLCDLASTAYYIGGIVESQIGKAAPWFILAVMAFSYAVRSGYIESCSMFTRGGVYRIVKEAMGGTAAKLAVSALLFDYVLTGPISGVSAGQYLLGLVNEGLTYFEFKRKVPEGIGSAVIAALITTYFWRSNVRGLKESTGKALKIMMATTVMAVVMIAWCGLTIAMKPETRQLPSAAPDLSKKVDAQGKPQINEVTGLQDDPLGWLGSTEVGAKLRDPAKVQWFSLLGALGILIAFGHSVLAMSGEETLAQVYREVEAPKLVNFKKAAFIVFVYSVALTSLISFFAVMIIPDARRTGDYQDNLIGGLAMSVVGPTWAKLVLHGVVVVVGFLILSGSVNTAIVGSNGVLSRVAEDGVLSEWFLKPHPKYGTTTRLLNLIYGLQMFVIVVSHGSVILLGEAYAFGVIWSFVFMASSMFILRFKRPGPRPFMVPGNFKVGKVEVPVGIGLIFLVLFASASVNLITKQVATISGGVFSATLFLVLVGSQRHLIAKGKEPDADHPRLEEFNVEEAKDFDPAALGLTKADRTLVGIRSEESLEMLKAYLQQVDTDKTDVVVVAADIVPRHSSAPMPGISHQDQELLTKVVTMAEDLGKPVHPIVVPTDDAFAAIARIARGVKAREVVMGPSRFLKSDPQFDRMVQAWGDGPAVDLRILGAGRDEHRPVSGG